MMLVSIGFKSMWKSSVRKSLKKNQRGISSPSFSAHFKVAELHLGKVAMSYCTAMISNLSSQASGDAADKVDHDNQLTQNRMTEMESCFCKIVQGTGHTSGVQCVHAVAKRDPKKAKWLRDGEKEKMTRLIYFMPFPGPEHSFRP